jgi:DNA-binding PadR family transcriptional regulator
MSKHEERWHDEDRGPRGRGEWGAEHGHDPGWGRGRGRRGGSFRGGPGGPGAPGGPFGPGGSFGSKGPFGPGGPGGPGGSFGSGVPLEAMFTKRVFRHGFGRGPRARRGDVRAAILDLLAEGEPLNGYQIIQTIAERTHGVWRPSAGSVYPALQQLEDEGLIRPEGEGRSRLYNLTDEGRSYATSHAEELRSSWDAAAGMADEVAVELGDLIRQVAMATMEVARAGSTSQLDQARRVLAETRRSLYRILAGDADAGDAREAGEDAREAGEAENEEA